MSEKSRIIVLNMTNFFNRELFMYALGDIRFKKPVSLKKAAYIIVFLIIWTIPIILIVGIQFNLVFLAILIVPPVLLGNFAGKPVWGGKSLLDFLKTIITFAKEPKGWTDLQNNDMKEDVYYVESEIWVSRRRELQLLADLDEANKRKRRKTR